MSYPEHLLMFAHCPVLMSHTSWWTASDQFERLVSGVRLVDADSETRAYMHPTDLSGRNPPTAAILPRATLSSKPHPLITLAPKSLYPDLCGRALTVRTERGRYSSKLLEIQQHELSFKPTSNSFDI